MSINIIYKNENNVDSAEKENSGVVCSLVVEINDIEERTTAIVESIIDTSWISSLDAVDQVSISACSAKTILKMVNVLKSRTDSELSEEAGEYIISSTAHELLEKEFGHALVPLAEIIKERLSGNGGFDFHSESNSKLITFGEAKYSGKTNPHGKAVNQILDFIQEEKDDAELSLIKLFVSKDAVKNAVNNQKSYAAAFSINSDNFTTIIKNAEKNRLSEILKLTDEYYVVGVKISD